MHPLVVFFPCLLAFWGLCRVLTMPAAARLPLAWRLAAGAAAFFLFSLGASWLAPSRWTLLAIAAAAAASTPGLRGEGLRELTAALGRARFAVYLLSALTLSVLVHVFVPITTFLTSPGELGIHLGYLLKTNARDAMAMVYVAALVYALAFTPRMRTALALLALGMASLALVYSYVLPFGHPMMTGLAFEQVPTPADTRALRLVADAAVVALLALGLRALLLRYGGRPAVVGLALVFASLSIAAGVGIRRDGVGGAGGPAGEAPLAERPLRFSTTRPNVLILFLDRFMGSYVEAILRSDPRIAADLAGFTWYPRTVAAGQNSIAGIHPMLGGYDYLPVAMNARGRPLRAVSAEAFAILPYNFSRRGYAVNMVAPKGLGFTVAGDCSYLRMPGVVCTHIPQTVARRKAEEMDFPLNELAESSYADLLVLLGGMRGAPYAMKEVLLRRGPWRAFLDHSAGTTFREWAELGALGEMTFAGPGESQFNFVSNILPHEPYYLGEDCRPIREPLDFSREQLRRRGHPSLFSLQHAIGARCSLLLAADYMNFLKAAGVYDDTTIVIVSDHGIVGAVLDLSSRALAGGTSGPDFVNTRSLLLVKPRGAAGPLRVDETFLPNAEVPRIVCEEIGGCVNPYLGNRPIATDGRDDPFYVSLVPWQFSAQQPEAFVIDRQLALTGKDPYDARGWKEVAASAAVPARP
jgi:hypothetical protein